MVEIEVEWCARPEHRAYVGLQAQCIDRSRGREGVDAARAVFLEIIPGRLGHDMALGCRLVDQQRPRAVHNHHAAVGGCGVGESLSSGAREAAHGVALPGVAYAEKDIARLPPAGVGLGVAWRGADNVNNRSCNSCGYCGCCGQRNADCFRGFHCCGTGVGSQRREEMRPVLATASPRMAATK